RYGVKTATLTFGTKSFDMKAAPTAKSETKEAIEVTSLSDTVKQFITGAVKEVDEFTITLYRKDTGDITVDDAPASLSIAVTLENGSDTDKSVEVSFAKCIVTKVAYPNVDATGDRAATYDVTFKPDGSVA
ncbi:MAG: hypothetical protein HUJ65_03280, partial [Oscillospiraceae bacterium]|nr:hypothetical protein [Oscillospiraceae bacterium]